MKINKRGFTLVELLAVVIILLMISVLAVSSISSAIERNKAKQDNAKIDVIISYAKLYYDEHKNSLGENGCIELSKLGLDENEITKSNGEKFTGCVSFSGSGTKFEYK